MITSNRFGLWLQLWLNNPNRPKSGMSDDNYGWLGGRKIWFLKQDGGEHDHDDQSKWPTAITLRDISNLIEKVDCTDPMKGDNALFAHDKLIRRNTTISQRKAPGNSALLAFIQKPYKEVEKNAMEPKSKAAW
jgi:hypothetical protein